MDGHSDHSVTHAFLSMSGYFPCQYLHIAHLTAGVPVMEDVLPDARVNRSRSSHIYTVQVIYTPKLHLSPDSSYK